MAAAFAPGDVVEYRRASAPLQAWLRRGARGRIVEVTGRGWSRGVVVDFGGLRVLCGADEIRRIRSAADDRGPAPVSVRRRGAVPYYATETQGPGRRYWFRRAADARTFAAAKRETGFVVVADKSEWDDPDSGPTVWVGRASDPRTADVVAGIDPAAF